MLKFRSRLVGEWLAVTAGLVLFTALAAYFGWFNRADLVLYDLALKSWQREAQTDIVIVAVDEESLSAVGRWPWRRAVTAALLDRVGEGRAIGLDILLAEEDPEDKGGDRVLGEAITRSGRVVLPVVGEARGREEGYRPPAPAFATRAAALGLGHVNLDADGIARGLWLMEGPRGHEAEHFAYALLRVADPTAFPPLAPSGLSPAGDWRRAWLMLIPYAGPPGHFPTLSAADVLRGVVPPIYFRDKLVLVGVTAAGIGDNNPVPTSGNGRAMAGVEIAANAVDALRRGIALRPFPPLLAALMSVTIVLGLLLGLRRFSARAGLILSGVFGLAILTISVLLLRFGQAWFAPSAALFACALGYPFWSWRRLEAAQRFLDGELMVLGREGSLLGPGEAEPLGDMLESRIAVIRDATQRQKDARRFLADALESLPSGVLVADRSGKVVLSNAKAQRLLGFRDGQPVAGTPLVEILARLNPVSGEGTRLGDADSWRALKMEVASRAASAMLLDVAPCRDERGGYLGLIASLTDVSELKAARKSRDEAMRFLSHDMRSPLSTIVTLLDEAGEAGKGGEEDEQRKGLLSRIGRYARRSLALADDLLRLGRAEAADPKAFRELDLRSVLAEAMDEVWPQAKARAIKMEGRFEDEDGAEALVKGDGELLRRAFVNLLGNAVKFSGATVRLGLAEEGDRWKVTVEDDGPGIPPQYLPQLFTRYGRFPITQEYAEGLGPEGAKNPGGIGLGLVIVKAVADSHGGSVEVDTAPGRGARFIFWLPKVGGEQV